MSLDALVECVPNFSEGRDSTTIEAIAEAIRSIPAVRLLAVDPSAGANRTVYTFAGEPAAAVEAALAAAREARRRIDMRKHSGEHPRMGALDVCPFVPIRGISMEECVALSRAFGRRLAEELGVPVYLYEKSAATPSRASLAALRSGEYEGLAAKLALPEWKPDFGPALFDASWGATVAGAREFLIAYNVNLDTRDKKVAADIAASVRESGRAGRKELGEPGRVPGRLKAVRAIGWYIEEYACAQVSVNLLDYRTSPLHLVFETVKAEAEKRGTHVTGSELVGMVPLEAIRGSGRYFARKMGLSSSLPDAELVDIADAALGLSGVKKFDPSARIIEWAYAGGGKLVSTSVRAFVDSVSSNSPAPGGGSVAALAGALGAGLAAMTASLTAGKKAYSANSESLEKLAGEAQAIKDTLLEAVDRDTDAFLGLLSALRMPKDQPAAIVSREAALQGASINVTMVPMDTARSCLAALKLCEIAAKEGNKKSITDAAVGAIMAAAGVEGALLNVAINLAALDDEGVKRSLGLEMEALRTEAAELKARVLEFVGRELLK